MESLDFNPSSKVLNQNCNSKTFYFQKLQILRKKNGVVIPVYLINTKLDERDIGGFKAALTLRENMVLLKTRYYIGLN